MIQKSTTLSDLPPFPSDVPTAPIARISLRDILASDPSACASVLKACQTQGFFYLDLTSTSIGDSLLQDSETLLQLSQAAFAHPLESKT